MVKWVWLCEANIEAQRKRYKRNIGKYALKYALKYAGRKKQ